MKTRRRLVPLPVILSVLCCLLAACSDPLTEEPDDPPRDPDPPVSPARIEGRVDDGFGTSVAGAAIDLSGGPQPGQAFTGSDGRFVFPSLVPGSYSISASRDGFKRAESSIVVAAGETRQANFSLAPRTEAIAVVAATRIVSMDVDEGMVFEVDVAVLDENGDPVPGLGPSAFTMGEWVPWPSNATMITTQHSVVAWNGTPTPYSALLLMDQSGSIVQTDPANSRLMAGKVFLNALGPGDAVQLAAFASGGLLPAQPVTLYGTGFTANGSSFFGALDQLAALEAGSTPLYLATHSMISYVASSAPTPNKALVVFTDGDDTYGQATLQNVVDACTHHGVRLYMVALGSAVTVDTLGFMVGRCGGTVMAATDAPQLVSLFGTLGGILSGAATVYRTRWQTATAAPGCFCAFIYFDAPLTITVPGAPPLTTRVWLNIPWPYPADTPPTPNAITISNDFAHDVTIDPGGLLKFQQLVVLPATAPLSVSVWDCGEPGGCKWDAYTLTPGRRYRVASDPAGPSINLTILETP